MFLFDNDKNKQHYWKKNSENEIQMWLLMMTSLLKYMIDKNKCHYVVENKNELNDFIVTKIITGHWACLQNQHLKNSAHNKETKICLELLRNWIDTWNQKRCKIGWDFIWTSAQKLA